MKWINIPVEGNHNGDNQSRRSWDMDGEARKYGDQTNIGVMKNDYGYRGGGDGDEKFGWWSTLYNKPLMKRQKHHKVTI